MREEKAPINKTRPSEVIGGCMVVSMMVFWPVAIFLPLSAGYKIVGAVITISFLLWIGLREDARANRQADDAHEKLRYIIISHRLALIKVIEKCKDSYGNYHQKKYRAELQYFWDSIVKASLSADEIKSVCRNSDDPLFILDRIIIDIIHEY